MTDIPIDNMLMDFGIAYNEYPNARNALFEWGVIQRSPHRANIAGSKSCLAREVLTAAFLWHCNNGDCRQAAHKDKDADGYGDLPPLLVVKQSECDICGWQAQRPFSGRNERGAGGGWPQSHPCRWRHGKERARNQGKIPAVRRVALC